MVLFLFYAVFIWHLCFRFRRQWKGLAALTCGMLLLWLASDLYRMAIRWAKATHNTLLDTGHDGKLFLMLLALEAVIVAVVGIFFWCLPRHRAVKPCRRCKYELEGLDDDNPTCPECGLHAAAAKVRRRHCPSCNQIAVWRADEEWCPACTKGPATASLPLSLATPDRRDPAAASDPAIPR